MIIAQIFARSENNVIGHDNQLVWHLPKDLKFFKSKTLGHPIIMGRKTFDSLGKPLPGRTNIVVTRNKDLTIEGAHVVSNVKEALEYARKDDPREILIIGGSAIFSDTNSLINKIYLTEVKASIPGNVTYEFDRGPWKEISREDHLKDEKHAYDFSFVELVRK